MNLLLDTQIVVWTMTRPESLPRKAWDLLSNPENALCFSAATIWEIAVKNSQGRPDFKISADELREELLAGGCAELPINGIHAARVAELPALHKDPFDRILLAQAICEEMELLTSDAVLGRYPGPVIYVRK